MPTEPIAYLAIPAKDLKMLRETLNVLYQFYRDVGLNPSMVRKRLDNLINEIDRHRALGSDGKHGNLHTATCGCEDR